MTTTIAKFAHLQIPLEDVLKATDNFHDDNIIGRGGLGTIYKGRLQRSGKLIKIAALRLDRKHGVGDVEFWTEVSMLSDLKHTNIVSIIGFCNEKDEKIIITTYMAKGSLRWHLSKPNLTWMQRLKICVGVARALSYLHYNESRGYGVIHLNINSSTILLNKNLEAKLSGFKVSIKQSLNRMDRVILSEPIGTIGYMDPEFEKTKGATHKSDIYSFGVVLFEIMCGREAFVRHADNGLLAPLAIRHYENNMLKDIIHPDLLSQMSPQSLLKYSEVAYSCLKDERAQRPDANNIVEQLEKALELQLRYENLEKKLQHLNIRLDDIKLATNDFSKTYIIESWDDYTLYRAELTHFDKENHSYVEGKNKGEHPKGHTTVVIKRYPSRHDGFGEEQFFTEIKMLTSVKHRNIVTLLGFCIEGSEMILVTDNVSYGYLGYYLKTTYNKRRVLTWEKRLKICIDVAHALKYLHSEMGDQKIIINRNIRGENIALDENWEGKIVDFGLSLFLPPNQEGEALYPKRIDGNDYYIDPEYKKTGKLKRESDVYSFGVVMFEVLCGRLANDPIYKKQSDEGLAHVARQSFCAGTLEDMIDPIIKQEIGENNFVLNTGPNKDSLRTFIETAYKCVGETQDRRLPMEFVVEKLEKTLLFQKNNKDNPRIPLEDIQLATQNFNEYNCIGRGGFGRVYKGHFQDGDGFQTIVAKRLDANARFAGQGEQEFLCELQILLEYKHDNVIGFVGYCDEKDEKIIVSEYASRGSLDRYLNDTSLTWVKRLNICIDVASALYFFHGGVGKQAKVIHRDIKAANILLNSDWKAKLTDFGLSLITPLIQETDSVIDRVCGTIGYVDPLYIKSGFLTIESDIYSFGVVLFEILCGRSAFATHKFESVYLSDFIKIKFEEGKQEEVVFEQIREQIVPNSLTTFQRIAYRCLHNEREKRPTTKEVLMELKKALGFQTYRPSAQLELRRKEIKRQLAHLEIRLEDIVYATNNFADENFIKEDELGKDYKGQMLRSGQITDICARRFNCKYGHGDIEFQTEISMISSLQHKNIISFIGFCDEYDEKIIVYEHAVHGSLDQHLSGPNLTWFQRLKICLGVARAMSYIHYDVIHCDINSSKILLDKDWVPKISGFELSTKYPQSWKHRLLISCYSDNINMTPKYDVYCFGALLFEVLYGMKPMKTEDGVKLEPDDIINPDLREQMSSQSLTDFTKITYMCLNIHPEQRPTMGQIVKELEDVLELQSKHENLEHTKAADESTLSNLMKMEWMKIPLRKIKEATNGFDKAHFVASGGFGSVYKAELDVADIQNLPSTEGECPKLTRKTVAIKCIKKKQDEASKQGFLTEIELLTSCKHPNIISLLGFCVEADNIILVYEYATKGSLSDYLGSQSDYLGSTRKNINLTWAKRIQICLDIAHGIYYLHTNMEGKPRIIHRDIKSENILLDENLNAKVADFGLSKFQPTNQQASTIYTIHLAGTPFYIDPEYETLSKDKKESDVYSFKYKKASDIYSFGVVLFEMLSGRLAYDPIYTGENDQGLAPIARHNFNVGMLKEMIDPKMIEEDDEHIITLNRGPNQESFEAFSKIAYQCLAETQAKRPTMDAVIKELQIALNLQGETIVLTRFRLSDIMVATENFSDIYCIGSHEYGKVYIAELDDFENKSSLAFKEKLNNSEWPKTSVNVAIKHISNGVDVKQRFFLEIEMRTSNKHPNMVSLIGFCDEGDDVILVYEHASNKSLDDYLKNVDNMDNLTWTQRLHVCLGIARGLNHLHTKMGDQERIIHGDIRSANILLGENLEPKIAYFGISNFHLENLEASTLTSTKVYWDPEFERTRIMKIESDVFSFGVILFEIFSGRLAYDSIYIDENDKGLAGIARSGFNDGAIKKLLDPKLIKEVINDDIITSIRGPNQHSLDLFLKIAHQCLEEAQAKRPTMETVIKELEIALNFQVSKSIKDAR